MYCQKCGKENPGGARFCMHCGADLSGYKVEISPKIDVSPKISVSAKAEGYPRCPNCENVLTDRNKLFSCQICGKKVCDTCGFHYNGLKLCERCKTKKEEEDRKENLRREEERKKRQREEERKRKEAERKRLERERHKQYLKEEEEQRQGWMIRGLIFLTVSILPIGFILDGAYHNDPDSLYGGLFVLFMMLPPAVVCIHYGMKK